MPFNLMESKAFPPVSAINSGIAPDRHGAEDSGSGPGLISCTPVRAAPARVKPTPRPPCRQA